MRILFVTNNYTPYSGGVVSSINAFTTCLQTKGHQVTIATLAFLSDHTDDPSHVYRLHCPVRFRYKTNHIAVAYKPYAQLKKLIREIKPDVVHVHHPFYLGGCAAKAARQARIPVVFTYHSQYEAYGYYLPIPTPLMKKIIQWRIRKFLRNVDHIIAPSSDIQNHIESTYGHISVSVLPSPIQDCFLQEKNIKSISSHKPFKLLYVGRFTKEKNIPFLLELMKQLDKNIHLTLVGYGSEEEPLKKYAYQKLKLSPSQVTFVRKPIREELLSYYHTSDLFVFSSTTETQGLVLAEAMAASRPVVALNGAGQNDIVVSGKNGYLVAHNDDMCTTIEKIRLDNTLYRSLQEGAYETAQHYTTPLLTEQLIRRYKRDI